MVSIDNIKIINVLSDDKNFCRNWRSLCRALEFGNGIMHDLERMDEHSSSIRDIIINIFGYCKSVSPNNFNAKTLSEKLKEIGCVESAETIEVLCGYSEDIAEESGLIWFNVRSPTRFFAGREKEMQIIDEQWVECMEKKMMLFVAITGLGGIGKSELAANYAKHFHESTKGHCIWIHAESNQTLMQSFQNLANSELKISLTDRSGQEKEINLLVQEIHAKLKGQKCLYIFDNLDSYEQPTIQWLKDLASKQRPSILRPFVLMTSRFQPAKKYFGNNCMLLELEGLNDEAAFQFFCHSIELKESEVRDAAINEVIQKLCHRLNYFPLAMQQAATYINENLLRGTGRDIREVEEKIAEYLDNIEIQTKKLLDHGIPDQSRATYMAWEVTFDKILNMTDGGMEATKLMHIISFMSPDNISVEFLFKIFEKVGNASNSPPNKDSLQILHDHSIVKMQKKESLSVHRLVQEVTRIKLKEGNGWIDTLDALLQILQEMMIKKEIKSGQLIHVQAIWKHATENTELIKKHGEFPAWISQKLVDSGKYREMLDFSCQALSTLESTLGENHRRTLKIKYWKGAALEYLGEYVKALELLTEVYEKQKELFGEEDGHSLVTATQIGDVHWRLKKYDEALEWYRNALEKRERIFGKEHPETLDLKHNMALVLKGQGKYKEAMELYQHVLEIEERVRGKQHPSTLITKKQSMAALRFSQGEYLDALNMFLEVLEVRERVFDVNHPATLMTKHWIAETYSRLGRNEEAVELYKEVLEKREEILGPEHPDTLNTKQKLADVSCRGGVLKGRGNILGPEHQDTMRSKKNVQMKSSKGVALENLGEYVKAEQKRVVTERHLIVEKAKMSTKTFSTMKITDQIKLIDTHFTDDESSYLPTLDLSFCMSNNRLLKHLHLDSSQGTKYSIPWNMLPPSVASLSFTNITVKVLCPTNDYREIVELPNIESMELNSLEFVDKNNQLLDSFRVNELLVSCKKIKILKVIGSNMIFDFNEIRSIVDLNLLGAKVIAPTPQEDIKQMLEYVTMSNVEVIKNGNPVKNIQTSELFQMSVNQLEVKTGHSDNFILDLTVLAQKCKYAIIKSSMVSFTAQNDDSWKSKTKLIALKMEHPKFSSQTKDGLSNFISNCSQLNYLSYHYNQSDIKLDIQKLPKTMKILELKGPSNKLYGFSENLSNLTFSLDKIILEETNFSDCERDNEMKCLLSNCKVVVIRQLKNPHQMSSRGGVQTLLGNLFAVKTLNRIIIGRFPWELQGISNKFQDWAFLSQYGITKPSNFYSIERREPNWLVGAELSCEDFLDISSHRVSFVTTERDFPEEETCSGNKEEKASHSSALKPNADVDQEVMANAQENKQTKAYVLKLDEDTVNGIIFSNLDYLCNKLTGIPRVLNKLIQKHMITFHDKKEIASQGNDYEKNDKLFELLLRKDLSENDGLQNLICIFKETGNSHLAAKLSLKKPWP